MNTSDANNGQSSLKDALYRDYNDGKTWQQRLHREAVHKALDIAPEDDVHISHKTSGLGWRELAIVVLGMTAGTVATGWFFTKPDIAPIPHHSPADSEYDVRFYDKDGHLIEVPPAGRRDARRPLRLGFEKGRNT